VTALFELTTMRVGAEPARLVGADTTDDLIEAVRAVWASDEPWFVLGGGSNTVASDEPFDGTVVHVRTRGVDRLDDVDGRVRVRVAAGEPWDDLVALTVAEGWSGLEALSGIPGSTGGSPVQNIGAYGQEVSSTVVSVDFVDAETGEFVRVPAANLGLGYRTSVFKEGREGVVTAVEFALRDEGGVSEQVAYPQLAGALGVDLGARVPVAEVRSSVLALRASKGMVLDADDRDTWSSGSFFTNPVVSRGAASVLPLDAPRWPVDSEPQDVVVPLGDAPAPPPAPTSGAVKLSAAWLIEHAGVSRGFRLPGSGAAVSTKHTLALTNRGSASASDVVELARFVQQRVSAEFGVLLRPEPVLLGLDL
jgi:UDP-N-acetylmuramate dehydrogenase